MESPLSSWINEKYFAQAEIKKIKKSFLNSRPYPNFALGDFFSKNKLLKLRKDVLREKYERIEKDLFSLSHTQDLVSSQNQFIKDFYSLLSSKEFTSLMERLTGEKLLSTIDMQSHSMVQGDYLLFHDDVVEGRKLAYIVYLKTLESSDGGALRLYNIKSPLNPMKKIIPVFNTFACFKVSSKSLHDVGEVKANRQRLTIGGWFYGN